MAAVHQIADRRPSLANGRYLLTRVRGIFRFVATKPPFKLERPNANYAHGMASSNVGKWPATACGAVFRIDAVAAIYYFPLAAMERTAPRTALGNRRFDILCAKE